MTGRRGKEEIKEPVGQRKIRTEKGQKRRVSRGGEWYVQVISKG